MYIVIIGTLMGAKTFHGPFESIGSAKEWVESHVVDQRAEIVKLERFV